MAEALREGFHRDWDGNVLLKMSEADYNFFLFMSGYYLGGLSKEEKGAIFQAMGFINRVNKGNPDFSPYLVKKDKQ